MPFRRLLVCALLFLPAVAKAEEKPAPSPEKLVARLRPLYAQATSFSPATMRHPLRLPSYAEVVRAKEEAEERPDDLETRWKAACLAEAAEDAGAQEQWQLAVRLIEVRVRGGKADAALLERQVEAMVGANLGSRVVPVAERLLKAAPGSPRAQLLAGDAFFRRADFNWRVLVRRSAAKDLPPALLIQMNSDLGAAQEAYDRAVELAPADPAPRAGRMALAMGKSVMAAVLPKGVMQQTRLDPLLLRRELLELVSRNPGKVAPLWHAGHFFATQSGEELPLSQSEREALERGLSEARPTAGEGAFLLEARALLHCALRQWAPAARLFEEALKAEGGRTFAAEWLATADANSPDRRPAVVERVRARLAAHPTPQDSALLGVLIGESDPKGAEDALRKAVAMDGMNPVARFNLGVLLIRRQPDTIEGRYHLQRALQLRSDDFEAQFAQAIALALEARIPEARRALQAVLAVPELPSDLRQRVEATVQDLDISNPG